MIRWRTFWRGFCEGLAALVPAFPAFDVQGYPHKSEEEALIADWRALGADMNTVLKSIEKARGI